MIFRNTIVVTVLLVSVIFIWSHTAAGQETGTILVTKLNMRKGPGAKHGVVARLAKGSKVTILAHEKKWLKIQSHGKTGFIRNLPRFVEIGPGTANTTNKDRHELKDLPQNAETIGTQLKQTQSELAAITKKEKAVLEEFDTAEEALNSVRQQVRAAKAGVADLDEKIGQIQKRSTDLEKEIGSNEDYAAQRLVALYKLNWVGRIHLLATAESFFDFISRKSALESILEQDEALLETLRSNRLALESLLAQLNARKAEKRSLELTLEGRIRKLKAQQDKRQSLLGRIRSEKKLELAALQALKEATLDLDATVKEILPAAPETRPKPEIGGKTDKKPFVTHKGLLSWPVKGKIISFFGPYRDKKYDVMNFQSGINIQAERGEPIRAVSEGYTIYSSWFKGFGNMMIIDHGSHYYTVYAHLEEVFKVKGDRVEEGEVIATVGDSGSLMGPALHFEVRYHGKPTDPLKWIRKG